MVNPGYFGKEKEIFRVLNREGVVTLFYFLDQEEFSQNIHPAIRRVKGFIYHHDILKGVYAEAPSRFQDHFLDALLQERKNNEREKTKKKCAQSRIQSKIVWRLMVFHPGDYILRNDQALLPKGIYAVYTLQDGDDASGGYIVFVDREGNHIRVPSFKNSLTLIKNPSSFYVKYVNHLAKGKRMFLLGRSNTF